MPRIFVCYRREDSAGHAGRIVDSLERRFGKRQVFMDVETVEPGADFVDAIKVALDSCFAFVAVIGRQWLTLADAGGRRRLDDPDDFIRRELEYALDHGVRVVPVLVQGAVMPAPEELPEDLRKLARIQALRLSDDRWDYDMRRMMSVIKGGAAKARKLRVAALVIAVSLAIAAGYWLVSALPGIQDLVSGSAVVPAQADEPGFYLAEPTDSGSMITASNLRAVSPAEVEATLEDFIEWCLRTDLPGDHRLEYGDVDFCAPGYYARYPAAAGQRLIRENLIEVGPLSEAPDLDSLVGRCFLRELAAGRTVAPTALGDC